MGFSHLAVFTFSVVFTFSGATKTTDTHKCATINALATICDDNYMDVTPDMVSVAIGKLKCGKACGSDRLFAEHYIHADSRLAVLLSTFFTSALTHGHVPDAFMQSILVPVIKNKSGDSNDVNNYRPIALVTIASKIFEMILLDVMEPFIVTRDNQFGFKKKHSTEHCIYALKNVISYYNWFGSPVYTCFLDASKAFDRVEHWSLFKKLIDRNVPLVVVRLLVHWYRQHADAMCKMGPEHLIVLYGHKRRQAGRYIIPVFVYFIRR